MAEWRIAVLAGAYSIHRLDPRAAVPEAVLASDLYWIGRTGEELSVVCPTAVDVAAGESSHGWSALRVVGRIPFSVMGLMAGISGALAAAGVTVFALSTFDTDYFLVPTRELATAREALAGAGFPTGAAGSR